MTSFSISFVSFDTKVAKNLFKMLQEKLGDTQTYLVMFSSIYAAGFAMIV
jgi:hypothetical protein